MSDYTQLKKFENGDCTVLNNDESADLVFAPKALTATADPAGMSLLSQAKCFVPGKLEISKGRQLSTIDGVPVNITVVGIEGYGTRSNIGPGREAVIVEQDWADTNPISHKEFQQRNVTYNRGSLRQA